MANSWKNRVGIYQGTAGEIQRGLLLSLGVALLATLFLFLVSVILFRAQVFSEDSLYLGICVSLLFGLLLGGVVGFFLLKKPLTSIERVEKSLIGIAGAEDLASVDGRMATAEEAPLSSFEQAYHQVFLRMKEADQKQHEFLGRLCHDIRSPLASLITYTELLSEPTYRCDDSFLDRCAQVLVKQGRQINEMLQDVQTVVSVETHRSDLKAVPFSISQLVEDVACEYSEKTGRLITCENQAGDLLVSGDALLLREALVHLISNSLKYSESNAPVHLDICGSEDPGWVNVSVRDHGIGISEKDQATLFKAFGRIRTPESQNIPGSGLGLYLVKKIAEYSNARIDVVSKPGAGSTFTISLPVSQGI